MKKIFLAVFLFSSVVLAKTNQPSIPKKVKEISLKFNLSMNMCPEKIWNNYSWNNTDVFFIYASEEIAYKWSGAQDKISQTDFFQLPVQSQKGFFNFFKKNNRQIISINMDMKIPIPRFELGIHEGFHFVGQIESGWNLSKSKSRGTSYPIKFEARYFRKMLFDKLVLALKEDSANFYQEAKYWYELWVKNFPTEVIATTDTYEGSAKYVETMATVIVENNCDVSESKLKQGVIQKLFRLSRLVSPDKPSLDSEGYAIGGLAFLLLRFKTSSIDWQIKAKAGVNPLESLLNEYNSKISIDDLQVRAEYNKKISEQNKEIGLIVDNDINSFADNSYIRIGLKYEWLQGNFMPLYFLTPLALPQYSIAPLSTEHRYTSPVNSSSLILQKNSILFRGDGPCLDQPIFLVHKNNIKSINESNEGNSFKFQSEKSQGLIINVDKKIDSKGFIFLCAK